MRPIDADELKKDLTRFYDNEVTAKQLIDEQPTIEPEQRWIPCGERQPDVNGWYVTTISGEICGQDRAFSGMSEFANGKWMSGDDVDETEMTIAWMPLPEPYQEGGKQDG